MPREDSSQDCDAGGVLQQSDDSWLDDTGGAGGMPQTCDGSRKRASIRGHSGNDKNIYNAKMGTMATIPGEAVFNSALGILRPLVRQRKGTGGNALDPPEGGVAGRRRVSVAVDLNVD